MENNNRRANPSIRVIGYIALILVTAVGLWEMVAKFMNGPIDEGTTQLVPWGIWVSGYIFFLGLSAGSFLISTLIYVFGVKQLEEAGPAALVQALGCLLLGGILIVLDAGHPERIYMVLLYFNPTSVMAHMGLFYNRVHCHSHCGDLLGHEAAVCPECAVGKATHLAVPSFLAG